MASASKETVTREVVTTVEEEEVVLRLSKDEADVLRILVSDTRSSGNFFDTDRRHVEAVRNALARAGVYLDHDRASKISGRLYFT